MITTRKNIINYYVKPYISIAFFGSILIYGVFTIATKGLGLNSFQDFKLIFSLFVLVFLCYYSMLSLFQIIQYVPIITIINNQLIFGETTYNIDDITNVKFTGRITIPKKGIKSTMLNNKEGSVITFNDGEEIYLFDHFYLNIHEVKYLLQNRLYPCQLKEEKLLNLKYNDIVFRDNQFLSLRGILLWLFIGYLVIKNLIVFPSSINTNGKIFIISVSLLLIAYHSRFMNYFILNKNELIIRNENFLWKRKAIDLNEIKEIVFEKDSFNNRRSMEKNYLRIIFKDFSSNRFCADLLYKSTWDKIKTEFEKINIPVRVER